MAEEILVDHCDIHDASISRSSLLRSKNDTVHLGRTGVGAVVRIYVNCGGMTDHHA